MKNTFTQTECALLNGESLQMSCFRTIQHYISISKDLSKGFDYRKVEVATKEMEDQYEGLAIESSAVTASVAIMTEDTLIAELYN